MDGTNHLARHGAVSIDGIKKNAPRIEVPTYHLTRQTVQQQFGQRIKELANDNLLPAPRAVQKPIWLPNLIKNS